jgi:hypothetical protein
VQEAPIAGFRHLPNSIDWEYAEAPAFMGDRNAPQLVRTVPRLMRDVGCPGCPRVFTATRCFKRASPGQFLVLGMSVTLKCPGCGHEDQENIGDL